MKNNSPISAILEHFYAILRSAIPSGPKKNEGLTLVELMIALMIASIAFVGIYTMSTQSLLTLRIAMEESRSSQAAQYEMEKLRQYTWEYITNLPSVSTLSSTNNYSLSRLNGGNATLTILPYPSGANPDDDMRSVSITITWNNPSGNTVTNVITSLLAEEGIADR